MSDNSELFLEQDEELQEFGSYQYPGPLQIISRLLRFDFCSPPENQTSSHDDTLTRTATTIEHNNSRHSHAIGGFDTVILTYPFDTLKKALQHGFCDPMYPENGSGDSSVMIQTCVSDETERASRQRTSSLETNKTDETMMDVDEDEEVLVVTEPGTGRWVRALRALEIFFFTIVLLVVAFRLLHCLKVDFAVEFKQINAREQLSTSNSEL